MTGRTRRGSTSSVETIDGKRNFWRQESSLLRSVAKGTSDIEWPIYELRDAVVLNKDGQTLESALDVGFRGPFIIRGTLVLDEPEQRQNLIIKVRGDSIPLEIRQCIRYSIGVSAPDAQPIIWVAGKSGFFEINPAPAYRKIYHKMCEATMLYYRMLDAHEGAVTKKVKKKKDYVKALAPIFHHYSTLIGDGSTLSDVVERCREHAQFLISHIMQEANERSDWEDTLFYKWLITENSDDLKKAEERLRNPPQLPRSPSVEIKPLQAMSSIMPSRTRAGSSTPSLSRSLPPEAETKQPTPRQRASRSQSTTQKTTEVVFPDRATPLTVPSPVLPVDNATKHSPPVTAKRDSPVTTQHNPTVTAKHDPPVTAKQDAPATDGKDPLVTLVAAVEWAYKEIASTRDGLSPNRLFNKIYFAYKFPNYKNGQTGCHRIPVEEVFQYNAEALLRALDKEKYGSHGIYPWLEEEAKKEFLPVAITTWPYPLIKRGARGPSSVNKLDAPRSVAVGPLSSPGFDEDLSTHGSEPLARGLGRGKRPARTLGVKSSLRLVATSKKRPHSEVESDSESDNLHLKKSHYFVDGEDDGEDDVEDGGSASSEGSEEDADNEPIKIVLRADKIPSTLPHGPDETWVCDQYGCDYVVRGGDEIKCKERIATHFKEHESQMQRVNLALTESRGQLPVNHLLDMIKRRGEKQQQNGQVSVNGVVLPKPIKRKLII